MGKSQDEHPAPAPQIFPPEGHEGNACDGCPRCRSIGRIARPRCVTTLVLAVAILLLVVFWLPPFVRRYEGAGRPDPDPRFSGEVVGWLDLGLLSPAISPSATLADLGFIFFFFSLIIVTCCCVSIDASIPPFP